MKKPSWPPNCTHFPQYQLVMDNNMEYAVPGLEMIREYVILKSSHDISSLTGNDYVYGLNALSDPLEGNICCYSSLCSDTFSSSTTTTILNHSYLQAEVGSLSTITNHYTNLENQ